LVAMLRVVKETRFMIASLISTTHKKNNRVVLRH